MRFYFYVYFRVIVFIFLTKIYFFKNKKFFSNVMIKWQQQVLVREIRYHYIKFFFNFFSIFFKPKYFISDYNFYNFNFFLNDYSSFFYKKGFTFLNIYNNFKFFNRKYNYKIKKKNNQLYFFNDKFFYSRFFKKKRGLNDFILRGVSIGNNVDFYKLYYIKFFNYFYYKYNYYYFIRYKYYYYFKLSRYLFYLRRKKTRYVSINKTKRGFVNNKLKRNYSSINFYVKPKLKNQFFFNTSFNTVVSKDPESLFSFYKVNLGTSIEKPVNFFSKKTNNRSSIITTRYFYKLLYFSKKLGFSNYLTYFFKLYKKNHILNFIFKNTFTIHKKIKQAYFYNILNKKSRKDLYTYSHFVFYKQSERNYRKYKLIDIYKSRISRIDMKRSYFKKIENFIYKNSLMYSNDYYNDLLVYFYYRFWVYNFFNFSGIFNFAGYSSISNIKKYNQKKFYFKKNDFFKKFIKYNNISLLLKLNINENKKYNKIFTHY
uniref:Orf483 n=1 Tax=Acavomonas peruviana TaxID=1542312 RepID=V5KVG9_9ALVE|nr:orf483 [Acavomonas peruviana]